MHLDLQLIHLLFTDASSEMVSMETIAMGDASEPESEEV